MHIFYKDKVANVNMDQVNTKLYHADFNHQLFFLIITVIITQETRLQDGKKLHKPLWTLHSSLTGSFSGGYYKASESAVLRRAEMRRVVSWIPLEAEAERIFLRMLWIT